MKETIKNKLQKENGITLIALVVTIVVLLILAGISISMVLGNNGLITKAKDAKTKTEQDQANTETAMNNLYDEMMGILGENGGSGDGDGDSIYFKDLRLAFDFIFTSRRLKSLMLYSAVMYGILMVMGTYEMGLLEEINLSATATGIIYAVMQFISGIASKKQDYFHNKFRNKTLTVLGMTYTISCLIAGIISVTNIPYIAVVTVILITYAIRRVDTGAYYVLIKKYLTNFTNEEVANKVYSAYGLVTGIGNTIVCAFGSLIVNYNNLKVSMIIFGAIFTVIMILVVIFMKNRVGLNPDAYRKKDINYKEYIRLK